MKNSPASFGHIDLNVHYTLGAGVAEQLGDKVEQAVRSGLRQCCTINKGPKSIFLFEGSWMRIEPVWHSGGRALSLHLSHEDALVEDADPFECFQEATLIGEGGSVLSSYTPGRPFKRTRVAGGEPVSQEPQPTPQRAAPQQQADVIAWQSIQNSKSTSEIEAFILSFRNSPFAGMARARLGELKKQQVAVVMPPSKPKASPEGGGGNAGKVFRDCPTCPEMVIIAAGSFMMGNPKDFSFSRKEKPVHRVDIDYSFAAGKYEVTQAQYQSIMNINPSAHKGKDNPVETVSWHDAQVYIRKLNLKTGLKYRLLTEAEWEYSARAGSDANTLCGNSRGCLFDVAWFKGSYDRIWCLNI